MAKICSTILAEHLLRRAKKSCQRVHNKLMPLTFALFFFTLATKLLACPMIRLPMGEQGGEQRAQLIAKPLFEVVMLDTPRG